MQNIHSEENVGSADPLSSIIHSLTELVHRAEDDFLALGGNLQQVQLQSSRQRQQIAESLTIFENQENTGALQAVSAFVADCRRNTRIAQDKAVAQRDNLARMMSLVERIAGQGDSLDRVGLFLHVIGVNAGIECARSQRMEAMFKVVSKDTTGLAAQIRQSTAGLIENAASAALEQKQTLAKAQKNIESFNELGRRSEEITLTAFAKVRELIDQALIMANQAERAAATITGQVNNVIIGVQFHDNLRQRVEHIAKALLERQPDSGESAEELRGKEYLLIELQKAQLDQLIDDLGQLYTTQAQALETIIAEIADLEQGLERMTEQQLAEGTQNGPLSALQHGLSAMAQLSEDSRLLGESIAQSTQRAGGITETIQGAIKNTIALATHVKINALNAIIKAAKFGRDGLSLQVLAQGMVGAAKDAHEAIDAFSDILGHLDSLTQTTWEDDSAVAGPEAGQPQQSLLEQAVQDFNGRLFSVRSECRQLTEKLQHELHALTFICRLKDMFVDHGNLIAAHAEAVHPGDEELVARLRQQFGRQLEERYTMEQERSVHNGMINDASLSQTVAPSSTLPPLPAESPVEIDLWGFDDLGAADSGGQESESETATESGLTRSVAVELFCDNDEESDPGGSCARSTDSESLFCPRDNDEKSSELDENNNDLEEFGSNVELF